MREEREKEENAGVVALTFAILFIVIAPGGERKYALRYTTFPTFRDDHHRPVICPGGGEGRDNVDRGPSHAQSNS